MSDSYRLVSENSLLESAYEKAKLLLQLETTWLPALAWLNNQQPGADVEKFPRWLHVLKPVQDTRGGRQLCVLLPQHPPRPYAPQWMCVLLP